MRSVPSLFARLRPHVRLVHARVAQLGDTEPREQTISRLVSTTNPAVAREAPTPKVTTPVVSAEEFRRREDITVKMPRGLEPLDPIQSFDTAPDAIKKAATMIRKFPQPTSVQAQCWPIVLAGHDLISIARTGSGKTLGFLIPALNYIARLPRPTTARYGPAVVVLAPTRELAQQIENEAKIYTNFPTVCAFGGVSKSTQIRALAGGVDIIIATPGRLNDLLSMEPPVTSLDRVGYLVLDEADRMLDMGFEPQLRQILKYMPQHKKRQTLMFSATWPSEVRSLAMQFLQNPAQINIGGMELNVNPDIEQTFVNTETARDKSKALMDTMKHLKTKAATPTVMVFCNTKSGCEQIAMFLREGGFRCNTLHGDKTQEQRDSALREFRDQRAPTIVCTDVAARGLDIKNVTAVINYDFPNGGVQDWIHRVGRTGRSGVKGLAVTFFNQDFDGKYATELSELLEKANQQVPEWMKPLVQRGAAPVPRKGYGGFGGGGGFGSGGGFGFRKGGPSSGRFEDNRRSAPKSYGYGDEFGSGDPDASPQQSSYNNARNGTNASDSSFDGGRDAGGSSGNSSFDSSFDGARTERTPFDGARTERAPERAAGQFRKSGSWEDNGRRSSGPVGDGWKII